MSTATIAPITPSPISFPQPKRWTVAEFHTICGEPAFENRRMILIEGEILEMPIPNPPHNACLSLVEEALRRVFGAGFLVRTQMPLVLGLSSDPMPDVAIMPGSPRDYSKEHPRSALLVVEISDSTLSFDSRTKANIYAAGRIQEYWVVDLVHRVLIVFRDPAADPIEPYGAAYRSRQVLDATATVSPLAAPAGVVPVSSLLP